MKILHVLDHSVPLHSGYAFRTLSILEQQRRLGWETTQLTSPKHTAPGPECEIVDGFRFYRTRPRNSLLSRIPGLDQAAVIEDTRRRLDDVLPLERPDIIHAHSPCLNGIAAVRSKKSATCPVVYEMRASWEDAAVDHGTTTEGSARYRLSRALETWAMTRATHVTTICEGLKNDILSRGIPSGKVTVIPNAVDIDAFPLIESSDMELRRALGLEGAFTLGFVGSFYGYEGLDILLDALPDILRFVPEARVLLVGGGFQEEQLSRQAIRLGVADKVVRVGRVPHAEVARYYGLIDLLVYPRKSIRLTETVTPLKPLEAMAQGCLLIASDVGGHRELIRDGETGFLFKPGRPDALVRAVVRAREAVETWPAMRAQGRRFVETERNWAVSVSKYRDVYEGAREAVKGDA